MGPVNAAAIGSQVVASVGPRTANKSRVASQADAHGQLAKLQWAVPALTGALIVLDAFASEQQRPNEVGKGLLKRSTPQPTTVHTSRHRWNGGR